jgi:hypothetical protein
MLHGGSLFMLILLLDLCYCVNVGSVANISEVDAAYISRVKGTKGRWECSCRHMDEVGGGRSRLSWKCPASSNVMHLVLPSRDCTGLL